MRRLVIGAVTVLLALQRRSSSALSGRGRRAGIGATLAVTTFIAACGGHSGHTPGGACDAPTQPPLVPTPLDFVSHYPFGSQARSLTGIQNAFDLVAPRFNAILTKARSHDPCAGGTVVVAMALKADGSVAGTQVIYDDTHPDSLAPQVEHEIQGMAFGAVAGDGFYTFQFPIRFNGPSPASSTATSAPAAGSAAPRAATSTPSAATPASSGSKASAHH